MNTTACKRLLSQGCVLHTDGCSMFQMVYTCQESPECSDSDYHNLRLRRSNTLGATWSEAESSSTVAGDGEWSVHVLADDTLILHDGSGDMYYSDDAGKTFVRGGYLHLDLIARLRFSSPLSEKCRHFRKTSAHPEQ